LSETTFHDANQSDMPFLGDFCRLAPEDHMDIHKISNLRDLSLPDSLTTDSDDDQLAKVPSPSESVNPSQSQLRVMIDTIPTLAWCAFPDGTVEFLNKRWLDYAGISQEQAYGSGWQRPVHPDDLDRLLETWRAILESGKSGEVEARLRRFDGEYRWFLFRAEPTRDEQGNIVRWYGTNTDIEELKRADRELRDVLDYAPQQVAIIAPDGRRLYANRVALEYSGITLEEFQADDYEKRMIHPDDLQRVKTGDPIFRGETYEFETRILGKDGLYRWFVVRFFPLRDNLGRILRWYSTGLEIQDRKDEESRVQNENLALREEVDKASMFEEIIGNSTALSEVLARVGKVAPTDSTVLITGETGTGKELIARAIHKRSSRAARAFVSVNCSAIPQSLIASELFGHEKGAFTGALQRRIGRFEMAEGGTLFLDEVGELPIETQVALLRVLQEREFERVGGDRVLRSDVRVITATNRDLSAAIAAGTFRSDLFYRLNVFPIELPPLRERTDDIPILVEYFINRFAIASGKRLKNISKSTMQLLRSYPWPGNVRELQNVVERSIILCETETFSVDPSWLVLDGAEEFSPTQPLVTTLTMKERTSIEDALAATRGRVSGPSGAAARLGIPASTLESKIRSLKINKHQFRSAQG
jgi:formate hydrogenlyase transcriptional activator